MRIGFGLPHTGPAATPENVVKVARRAEELGYDSLWVSERLLYPVAPQTRYAGTPDGALPDPYRHNLAPLECLTYVAALTERIALGTGVLVTPYYNPVVLARSLTALDVLSGGRLRVGLGLGWSKDEYDAAGATMKARGRRATEFIQVLLATWTTDPAEFQGEFFHLPKSIIQPKPVQKPHPPIYLAAYAPGALQRAATLADGWMPVGVPLRAMTRMWGSLQDLARQAGRDPTGLKLAVRANFTLTEQPLGEKRWLFNGSPGEIQADVAAVRDLGAHEIIFDPTFSPEGTTVEGFLRTMEQMQALAEAAGATK